VTTGLSGTSRVNRGIVAILALIGLTLLGHSLRTTTYRDARDARGAAAVSAAAENKAAPTNVEAPRRRVEFLIKGFPLELYGIAWFLLVLSLEFAPSAGTADERDRFRFYLFYLSLPALSVLFAVAYALAERWRDFGWRQLVAAACAFTIFAIAGLSQHAPARSILRLVWPDLRLFVGRASTWIAASAFLALLAFQPGAAPASPSATPTGAAFLAWYAAQPRMVVPMPTEQAAVVIVKFNDYQCPPCKRAHVEYEPIIANLERDHPGAIRFDTRDYPLETECNRYVETDIHPAACEAAVAVRLAREHGRGAAMEQWLWQQQASLTPSMVIQAAHDIGGVPGTPTHFINGVRLMPLPKQDFEAAIRYELDRPRNGSAHTSN
jgi:uncharacterized membrane protein